MIRLASRRKRNGLSLIELIVAIVIIATAVLGVLSVMNLTTQRSADPLALEQAMLVGEAYVEEILLKPFLDPSSGTTNVCPTPETGGRIVYDNICDYNGLVDTGARDQLNQPVSGLEGYTVRVTVTGDSTVTLGPAAGPINNTGVLRVLRVDVRVQGPVDTDITLTAYRTNYNCNATGDAACLPL